MPGGAGKDDYSPMPEGGSGANYGGPPGGGDPKMHYKAPPPKNGKGTISTQKKAGFVASGLGFALGIEPLKWAGRLIGLGGKKKTEKQKSDAFTKKGFDVLNPNEMRAAKYKPVTPPDGGGEGMAQITLNTQSVASTAIPETKSGWGFKAYDSGSTANTRLYGKKGKMVKANQGQFSQGKRFGPPPKKGPDPQGINVPLNSIDYFKDLL